MNSVLVVGGSPDGRDDRLLRTLAEQCTVLVAVDAGYSACINAGLSPDLLVGDLDSITDEERASVPATCEMIVAERDKDETDLEIAFRVLLDRHAEDVTVTRVCGGRVDHQMAVLGALEKAARLRPVVIERDHTIRVLSTEGHATIEVEGEGVLFSLMAPAAAVVSVSGARWELDRRRLEPCSGLGLSNQVDGACAVVTVHAGVVFVIVPRHA